MSKMKKIISLFLLVLMWTGFSFAQSEPFDITFAWKAPVENEDGTPLEDLMGFKLYQRADTNFVAGQDVIVTVTNNVISTPQIQGTNSVGGAYGEEYSASTTVSNDSWFTVTAFDFSGNESVFSIPKYIDMNMPNPPGTIYLTFPPAPPPSTCTEVYVDISQGAGYDGPTFGSLNRYGAFGIAPLPYVQTNFNVCKIEIPLRVSSTNSWAGINIRAAIYSTALSTNGYYEPNIPIATSDWVDVESMNLSTSHVWQGFDVPMDASVYTSEYMYVGVELDQLNPSSASIVTEWVSGLPNTTPDLDQEIRYKYNGYFGTSSHRRNLYFKMYGESIVTETNPVVGVTNKVQRLGSPIVFSSGEASPQTVVVPDGADFAVVATAYFDATATVYSNLMLDAGTFIGTKSFTLGPNPQRNTANQFSTMYYMDNPPTGTNDFVWSWPEALSEGPVIFLSFYSGVNPTNSIQSSSGKNGRVRSVVTEPLSIDPDDLMISVASSFTGNVDHNVIWTNATEISRAFYRSDVGSFAEKTVQLSTTNFTVSVGIDTTDNGTDSMSIVTWVLNGSE